MLSKKIAAYVVLFVGLTLVFSSLITVAQAPDRATKEANSKTLVIAIDQDPQNLNTITTSWGGEMNRDICDTLVSRDYQLTYQDGIAKSWDVSPDGLEWTFRLKGGVTFHDGTPCDAEAIAWNIETMRDIGASAYLYSAVEDAVAVDPLTVKLILKNPFPNLLYNMSSSGFASIVSPTAFEEYGEDYGVKTAVGTGPYMFVEWVRGDHVTLKRNPDYNWAPSWLESEGPAYFDKVIYKVVPEAVTKIMLLQAGEVDIAYYVSPSSVSALQADPNVEVTLTPERRLVYMGMNVTAPPFDDVRVRRAMEYIVDRESIVENVLQGIGQPAYNYLAPIVEPQIESPYTYNLDKARELLAEAGWTDEDGDGILEKNGAKFIITLWTDTVTERVQIATVIQSEMAELGIKAEIQQFDSATYADMFKSGRQQAFMRLYGWDNADILEWFFNSQRIDRGVNKTRMNEPLLDSMFIKAESMPTSEERLFVYRLLHEYLLDTAPWVPVYYPQQIRASRADLGGYVATLDHIWLHNLYRK